MGDSVSGNDGQRFIGISLGVLPGDFPPPGMVGALRRAYAQNAEVGAVGANIQMFLKGLCRKA